MHSICAVITTFDPGPSFEDNLIEVSKQVSQIVVVNDSGFEHSLLNKLELSKELFLCDVIIINNKINIGIAASLNSGVKKAEKLGHEYVLTLDDDTLLSKNYVSSLLAYIVKCQSSVSLVNGSHISSPESKPISKHCVITSGSIFKICSFNHVNGFDEDLFIDYVDFDFCLKLKKQVGDIMLLPNIMFSHTIGNVKHLRLFNFEFISFNHQSFRIYYQARNLVNLVKNHIFNYPVYVLFASRMLITLPFKIIFIDDFKFEKLKFFLIGFVHGLIGRHGKLK